MRRQTVFSSCAGTMPKPCGGSSQKGWASSRRMAPCPAASLDCIAAHTHCPRRSSVPEAVLCGLIGAGIRRSLAPALHEEEARHHGLRLHYQLIDLASGGVGVEALPALLQAVRIIGFRGLNITFPCKQTVIPLLDALSEEARTIGAVNTVVREGDRLVGYNTDASG